MTRSEKNELRSDLFRHLDGIVTAPTAFALYEKGVLDFILAHPESTLAEISEAFQANEGYPNVALHIMAAQGWLAYEIINDDTIKISTLPISEKAFQLVALYEDVVKLMKLSAKYHPRKFEVEPFVFLEKLFAKYMDQYGLVETGDTKLDALHLQILKHIEGIIVGPTAVGLGMSGMFHNYFMEASFDPNEFHADGDSFARLLDMFVQLGWFEKNKETYRFTEKGLFFARRASAYGVTVSYIPTFRRVEDLIFKNTTGLIQNKKGQEEIHVDRAMNVWGSGGAHTAYFKVIDDIIIDIFNQPIDLQPKGILDMGCGNGAFLIHLYEIIEQKTLRGKLLDEHPLFLIGADYNQASLKVTRQNIIQAGIWAKLIWGDIGRPDLLADDLYDRYSLDLRDVLNVRTFLDHNRIWSDPITNQPRSSSTSLGAFAFQGRRIPNSQVEDNLKEHFEKWAPYVGKFGLLVIELHTISPSLIAQNLGKTAATAYNATHGFSDQFIVEIDVFQRIAQEAGLFIEEDSFAKFPNSDLATISIQLFKAKQRTNTNKALKRGNFTRNLSEHHKQ